MLRDFLPKEVKFFDLFRQSTHEIELAAREFVELVRDPVKSGALVDSIADHEHKADEITHSTMKQLHQTFITPIDREEIHQLICKLDDIVDHLHAASQRIRLYDVTKTPPELQALAAICLKMAGYVKEGVEGLENLKKPGRMLDLCVAIHDAENEADKQLRAGVARLFREETDVKTLLKLKEIIELVETATDCCEDVANVLEGIVLEHA